MRIPSWLAIKLLLAVTSLTGILNLIVLITFFNKDFDCNHDNPSILRRQISSIDTASELEDREIAGPKYGHLERLNLDLKDILDRYSSSVDTLGEQYQSAQAHPAWIQKRTTAHKDSPQLIMMPSCDTPPFLLILIHSSPESFARREAIRLSWGRQDNAVNQGSWIKPERTWKTVFVVGRSNNSRVNALVQRESHIYDDVLLGNFQDTYRHLSLKMLHGIAWPLVYCDAKYVMKTDDDCFVNIIPLILWLHDYDSQSGHSRALYVGKVQRNMKVVRTKNHRYRVTKAEHPAAVFKPYASGGGYLFSGYLMKKLHKVSKRTPLFPVEDALFGRLMDILNIQPTHDKRFLPFVSCRNSYETLFERPMCHFKDPFVVHGVSETQQIYMHYNVLIMNFIPTICSYVEHQSKEDRLSKVC